MKTFLFLAMAFGCLWLLDQQTAEAQATDTCAGQTSVGNPFPCCSAGNCTWWAWKMMKDNWGIAEPDWHDAQLWASNATSVSHHNVISIPSVGTIGVYIPADGSIGHVAYVTQVNNDGSVYVTEMNCGGNGVTYNKFYSANFFNGGYIYPPIADGTPNIQSMGPSSITHSGSIQNITFVGINTANISAVVVQYPGGHAVLTGSGQIISRTTSNFTVAMTMGTSGNYSVQAVNNNGTLSNIYGFSVF